MGASDYFVGSAPGGASYQSPNLGPWLAEQIGSIPRTIFDAGQRKLTRAKQNAFPDGPPTNPDGTVDVNAVIKKGFQLGGLDYAGPLMQLLMQQNIGEQAARGMPSVYGGASEGNGTKFTSPAPTPAPQPQGPQPARPSLSAAGPGNLTPPPQRTASLPPQGGGGPMAQDGQDSLRSLAT